MPPLYVVQQGAKIRIRNYRLQVDLEGKTLTSKPIGHVSQLVLYGNISLTTPAISTLLSRNCDVVFLSRRGDYRGRLVGEVTPHVPLRRAQYQRSQEPEFVLRFAGDFVSAKLSHQRALLQRHNREHRLPQIYAAVEKTRECLQNVSRKTSLSALLGLEGTATRAYFSGLRCLIPAEWRFANRNRRPPRDPINVLLSFGYTLITNLASSAVEATGLDPYCGFLHQVAYNRPALGLDLVEEFRPVVDGIVLWCTNSGQITPQDFTPGPPERPVVLSEDGQRRFLRAFEQRMEQKFTHPLRGMKYPIRLCMLEQARQIAGRVQSGEAVYQGMGFR